MTHQLDGNRYLLNMDYLELYTRKSFKSREACATFAKNLLRKVGLDETLQSITIIEQDEFEDSFVLIVTIDCSDGISAMMLRKLDELLNT
jgi:hypothetical protein